MPSDEELLRQFYAGDDDAYAELVERYSWQIDQFLRTCIKDRNVVVQCWKSCLLKMKRSRLHPELRFDLSKGPVKGYLFSTAGHLAFRWLVELKDPRYFM
jgi:hypothetical protein